MLTVVGGGCWAIITLLVTSPVASHYPSTPQAVACNGGATPIPPWPLSSFHPPSTPRAIGCEVGGRWCVVHRGVVMVVGGGLSHLLLYVVIVKGVEIHVGISQG
jgi:hypothetical protein